MAQSGTEPPDLDDPARLKGFFAAVQELLAAGQLLAYHDRSDGGLFVTLAEMAFAGHCGLDVHLDGLTGDPLALLFSRGTWRGAAGPCQGRAAGTRGIRTARSGRPCARPGCAAARRSSGDQPGACDLAGRECTDLHRAWSETSFHMQRLRDNPVSAQQEWESKQDARRPRAACASQLRPERQSGCALHRQGQPPAGGGLA